MSDIEERLRAFARAGNLQVFRQMGFGVHGRVFMVGGGLSPTVVKVCAEEEPYRRERNAYLRLRERGIDQLMGFHVPGLISCSDELRVLHMSLVTRPFCLDFAAAYLDSLPSDFPAMDFEWESAKLEQFGSEKWELVEGVLGELRSLGIYQTDVSPTNISP